MIVNWSHVHKGVRGKSQLMSVDIIGIRMTRKGYVISAFVMGLPPQWLRCTLVRAIYTGFVFEKPFFPDVTLWPRCVMKSDESNSDSLNEFVYGFCGDCFSFLNKFTCVSEKSEHDYSRIIALWHPSKCISSSPMDKYSTLYSVQFVHVLNGVAPGTVVLVELWTPEKRLW